MNASPGRSDGSIRSGASTAPRRGWAMPYHATVAGGSRLPMARQPASSWYRYGSNPEQPFFTNQFIAAARTAVPALVARVRALEAELGVEVVVREGLHEFLVGDHAGTLAAAFPFDPVFEQWVAGDLDAIFGGAR